MHGGAECAAFVMLLPDGGMQGFFTTVEKNGEQGTWQDKRVKIKVNRMKRGKTNA